METTRRPALPWHYVPGRNPGPCGPHRICWNKRTNTASLRFSRYYRNLQIFSCEVMEQLFEVKRRQMMPFLITGFVSTCLLSWGAMALVPNSPVPSSSPLQVVDVSIAVLLTLLADLILHETGTLRVRALHGVLLAVAAFNTLFTVYGYAYRIM